MLTPRELEVLDVVGEVMQERLQEVRKEYEGKLGDLQTKVAALEARPMALRAFPDDIRLELAPLTAKVAEIDERVQILPLPISEEIHTLRQTLTEKVATLEARAPEVTLETLRKMGDDLEEVIERRLAMLPPPPDLTPLNEKFDLLQARGIESHDHLVKAIDETKVDHINLDNLHARVMAMEATPPVDLDPLAEKIAALESKVDTEIVQTFEIRTGEISEATKRQIEAIDARIAALPPPPIVDLTWYGEKIAELETRPTNEEVLKLAEGALNSTRANMVETLQISMIDLFKALPIPEKGEKGEPGINGTSVTAEQFRDLFEASYAKFELETERRIMDLVQRTLDRIPVPKDGKPGLDGFGFDDLSMAFDGERTITFRFEKGERMTEFPFVLPYPLDKNVWKAGTPYVRGDGVTWGGSWFIAQRDNPGKPEDGADNGWRLAVKHGRDGKPGTPGLKGDPGAPGKNGRDLNQRLSGGFDP